MSTVGKFKKFASFKIRKIVGGKDSVRIIEDFILRRGADPEKCVKEREADLRRWMLPLRDGEELEILLEGLRTPHESTIYMGVNILTVPIRGASELLAAALEVADGLIGIKVSLVGHFLVLSSSMSAAALTLEDVEHHFNLIEAQEVWFRDALAAELKWEEFPD
jgi:hypothetical protein